MSNINGVGNSFSATIDGLNSFELSSLVVDEIDAGTINVETEIFTPIVVLKDGVNTTTMSQSGLETIIQNDENLGTMTFNTKGPFGANVQSLTLSYLTSTVNTSVLQVNGRVQPNTIRFPDGVTVGDKVVYLRGDNIYKDYKVTLRNSPDANGDLFYNIPLGYAHTFSYGDTSYVNILSIRSNGDIVFTDIIGNKITYYTGYSTEIATNILRHIVPSSASHRFKVGTTDIMTIDSAGVNVLVTSGNIALKDAANTFTQTNTFPQINFTDAVGTKLQYYTGYTTEIQTNILRHNVPTGATQRFAINGVDMMTILANVIDVNPTNTNTTTTSRHLTFYTHPTNQPSRGACIGYNNGLIYRVGGAAGTDTHSFRTLLDTTIFTIASTGVTLNSGDFTMSTGVIQFPLAVGRKINYYSNTYYTEVQAGILRNVSVSQHIWMIGAIDVLTLSATALTCEEVIYAKNALRTDDALFLYDQTIVNPVNRSRLYHYNANLYIDNKTIGGLTFIQSSDASGNPVDVFEVGLSECRLTAVDGLIVRDGTGVEGSIFCINYGGTAPYIEMRNAMVNGGLAFSTLDATSNVVYPIDISTPTLININGTLKLFKDYYSSAEGTIFMDPFDNMVFRNLNNDYVFKGWTGSVETTALTLNATDATLGSNVSLQQSGTGIINQAGTGTNELKNTDVNGTLTVTGSIEQSGTAIINQTGTGTNQLKGTKITGSLEVTGSLTLPTIANVAYVNATQTFTGTNTFNEQVTMNKSLNLPTTYYAKVNHQLGYSGYTVSKPSSTVTLATGAVTTLAEVTLPIGEYMLYGLASYFIQTAGSITTIEYSISSTAGVLSGDALIREYSPSNVVGYPIVSLDTFVTVTASTTFYLSVCVTHTTGTYQRNATSAGNVRFKAVRIA